MFEIGNGVYEFLRVRCFERGPVGDAASMDCWTVLLEGEVLLCGWAGICPRATGLSNIFEDAETTTGAMLSVMLSEGVALVEDPRLEEV
jgi:hypothetical protein